MQSLMSMAIVSMLCGLLSSDAVAEESDSLSELEEIEGAVIVEETFLIRKQTDKLLIEILDVVVIEADPAPEISSTGAGPKTIGPTKYRMEVKPDRRGASLECTDSINQVVRRFTSQIKHCYNRSLKMDPTIAGRVVVDVDIANGKVIASRVSQNKTGNVDLASCMQRKITRWDFPENCSQSSSFPFVLSPQPF